MKNSEDEARPSFGELHRQYRLEASKTLQEVADLWNFTRAYIADYELSRRAPPTEDKIVQVAAFFGRDPKPLLQAARRERGYVVDVEKLSNAQLDLLDDIAGDLASAPGLNRAQTIKRIRKVINPKKEKPRS
jgi:transcriptional regulator with XRE-family HTH domain